MAIFTMSDLHLALSVDKPMNVFGTAWDDYMQRIHVEWNMAVSKDDTVVVGGDVSWAMHLNELNSDFEFINSLNGKKILLKGNHDYWWEGMSKMNRYLDENEFSSISFMQNNAALIEDMLVCGSRGWIVPNDLDFSSNDRKIYERELQRLELSFLDGERILKAEKCNRKICVLHYPPFSKDKSVDLGFENLMKKYGVTDCIYGHLHAAATKNAFEGENNGIVYKLVSADYLQFKPFKL